jgi:2-polyprenyl-3-methyl-5-hydroxy-6-metoxy-1,4-benzoquinol methylase
MNGFFFFHTYNRTWLSWGLVYLFHRWFAHQPEGKLHAYNLFIKPGDFTDWLGDHRLSLIEMHGIRPKIFQLSWFKLLFGGKMDPRFRFKWTSMKLIAYAGIARKVQSPIY